MCRFGGPDQSGACQQADDIKGLAAAADKTTRLVEMARAGFPVPPGFVLHVPVRSQGGPEGRPEGGAESAAGSAAQGAAQGAALITAGLRQHIRAGLSWIEAQSRARFGGLRSPLLLAVRAGQHRCAEDASQGQRSQARAILHVGLNGEIVKSLAQSSGDARLAADCHRRFIQAWAETVTGLDGTVFADLTDRWLAQQNAASEAALTEEALHDLACAGLAEIERASGAALPRDPHTQLMQAISAIACHDAARHSGQTGPGAAGRPRRQDRQKQGAQAALVIVQAMVFGNRGTFSGSGRASSRRSADGRVQASGKFVSCAQGDDLAGGLRRHYPLTEGENAAYQGKSLQAVMPEAFAELSEILARAERHFADPQEIDFTIDSGTLWILQAGTAPRSAAGALRIAVDLAQSGVISRDEALMRIRPESIARLLHPVIDDTARPACIARGLPASPGVACGILAFHDHDVQSARSREESAILLRHETTPADMRAMQDAAGIVTIKGGMTSHAAVLARSMGRPCVCALRDARIDGKAGIAQIGQTILRAGDMITVDGTAGAVYRGAVTMRQAPLCDEFHQLMGWADARRTLGVRANADMPDDIARALRMGAEGVGLCRTEHMFLDHARLLVLREVICTRDSAQCRAGLEKILTFQRRDFARLLATIGPLPITIRLLDAPLHEFLPRTGEQVEQLAAALKMRRADLERRITELGEVNSMLGMRGCRLAVHLPELAHMQARALFEAAADMHIQTGKKAAIEIMVPFIAWCEEFTFLARIVRDAATQVSHKAGVDTPFRIGAMMELPRACLQAGRLAAGTGDARGPDFFSFGTNDLTQTCLGVSRDDADIFLARYRELGFLADDPFHSIDRDGVGELIEIAVKRGRAARADLVCAICGEHGGDRQSIRFCHDLGLDYVSSSPYRVPAARLAAAQAAIAAGRDAAGTQPGSSKTYAAPEPPAAPESPSSKGA